MKTRQVSLSMRRRDPFDHAVLSFSGRRASASFVCTDEYFSSCRRLPDRVASPSLRHSNIAMLRKSRRTTSKAFAPALDHTTCPGTAPGSRPCVSQKSGMCHSFPSRFQRLLISPIFCLVGRDIAHGDRWVFLIVLILQPDLDAAIGPAFDRHDPVFHDIC